MLCFKMPASPSFNPEFSSITYQSKPLNVTYPMIGPDCINSVKQSVEIQSKLMCHLRQRLFLGPLRKQGKSRYENSCTSLCRYSLLVS